MFKIWFVSKYLSTKGCLQVNHEVFETYWRVKWSLLKKPICVFGFWFEKGTSSLYSIQTLVYYILDYEFIFLKNDKGAPKLIDLNIDHAFHRVNRFLPWVF